MSYDNPNFTVIMPGGCNSTCSFCTDPYNGKASNDYLANLMAILADTDKLPEHFTQVSISGGEPTLSPLLGAVMMALKLSNRFTKIVFTTNGAKLKTALPVLKETIDHINISRHAIGYDANSKIFGTKKIVTDEELPVLTQELRQAGIDVNFNHVYTKEEDREITKQYVLDYVAYAKKMGATSVSFRYDQNENSLKQTRLESLFADYKIVKKGGCPVCRNHTILIDSFPVVFKASYAEPSNTIAIMVMMRENIKTPIVIKYNITYRHIKKHIFHKMKNVR